jgi:hypothetical protein
VLARLKQAIRETRMTQGDFAERCDIPESRFSRCVLLRESFRAEEQKRILATFTALGFDYPPRWLFSPPSLWRYRHEVRRDREHVIP